MSKTGISTSNNLTRKLWDRMLYEDMAKKSYFMPRFANTKGTSFVHEKTDLEAEKGDKITFGIRMRLDKEFIVDSQSEGYEHSLTFHDYSVTLHKYRVPVRDDGELTRKRTAFDIEKEARQAIADNGAEKMDKLIFTTLTTNPTRVYYTTDGSTPAQTATASTAKSALTTSSLIFPKLISYAKSDALARRSSSTVPINPVIVDGKPYVVLLVHTDVRYDLANNTTMQQAHREARERGKENPIFSGADFIYDGVVIHSHESVPTGTDAGASSNVPWAKCIVLGQQAVCWAWGRRPKIVADMFDYENEHGFDWSIVAGCAKPVFNSVDYGSRGFYVARTQVHDA